MPGVLVRHRGRRGKILGVQIGGLRPNSWGSMAPWSPYRTPYLARLYQTANDKGNRILNAWWTRDTTNI